jgi:predicted DNA-binding transcriptional regulator YafY
MKSHPSQTTARPAFERLIALLVELAGPQCVTNTTLAAKFHVSTKTVQRDMDFIRDRLMLEVEFDSHHCRWQLIDREKAEAIGAVFSNL